jgi:hypothetical protein
MWVGRGHSRNLMLGLFDTYGGKNEIQGLSSYTLLWLWLLSWLLLLLLLLLPLFFIIIIRWPFGAYPHFQTPNPATAHRMASEEIPWLSNGQSVNHRGLWTLPHGYGWKLNYATYEVKCFCCSYILFIVTQCYSYRPMLMPCFKITHERIRVMPCPCWATLLTALRSLPTGEAARRSRGKWTWYVLQL